MSGGRGSIGEAIDPTHNSLNFLRLVLASMVLFSHAYVIGHFGSEAVLNGTSFGTVAVYGFFGISGYLIAGSALRNGYGRYLWQRFLRIFPGFWVCLIVTSFGFGVIGWLSQHHGGGYFSQPGTTPFGFDYNNWWLDMRQFNIGATGWNGSLWTLFYEFLCYLSLLVLSMTGLLKLRPLTVLLTLGLWFVCAVITVVPWLSKDFSVFGNWWEMNYLKFVVIFLFGALIYLYREHIPDSALLAVGCFVAFAAALWLPDRGLAPAYSFTLSDLGAPLLAYPLLWLGGHLPFQRIGAKNDYSYGVYIYAYPVSVLLAIWGAYRLGYVPFAILCVLGTIPLAAGSWWLVEKRAMSLRKFHLVSRRESHV